MLLAFVALGQIPANFWDKSALLGKGELAKVCRQGGYVPEGTDTRRVLIVREDGSVRLSFPRGHKDWKLKPNELSDLRKEIAGFDPVTVAKVVDHPKDGIMSVRPVDDYSYVFVFRFGKDVRVWRPQDHVVFDEPPILRRFEEWSDRD